MLDILTLLNIIDMEMEVNIMKQNKLIIVESPSKAKTIASYLDNEYKVISSKGHIRDLATTGKDGLGIDIENRFQPNYRIIKKQEGVVNTLKKEAKNRQVLIATDDDREGEAIGWHIAEILDLDLNEKNRIVFREITKSAIIESLNEPRKIDQDLVNSQEARRILDRIIGFKLSKLLQSKIKSKSAGRVQSVALKLISDLEKEIQAFIPETYYEIEAKFPKFTAHYVIPAKQRLSKVEADTIVSGSTNPFVVKDVKNRVSRRKAKPALKTSTLQQEAFNFLSMSSGRTMMVAQKLYEGVQVENEFIGLITYMRTDSTRLANTFIYSALDFIEKTYGEKYKGFYQTKNTGQTQDAHEAIRPTSLKRTPELMKPYLTKDEYRLYNFIFYRTLSSLMSDAQYTVTKVTLDAQNYLYELEGSVLKFAGHREAFAEQKIKDTPLPKLELSQQIDADEVIAIEKVTLPPARYSEATLIKTLEANGIGRPSTYASIIKTLRDRDYVELDRATRRFKPTEQGMLTTQELEAFFDPVINVNYTSKMEKQLDEISEQSVSGVQIVGDFYNKFIPLIEHAQKHMKKIPPKETGELCPECGRPLVYRKSKYGEFVACSGFPQCKYVQPNEYQTKATKKAKAKK